MSGDNIVFRRLRRNERKNADLSLTYRGNDSYNVFNERTDNDIGSQHKSRLIPSFSEEQLAYVRIHGTTNFVRTSRTKPTPGLIKISMMGR